MSTSNRLACACGCGQPVKPGQRWREPACKARAYRARQRAREAERFQAREDEYHQAFSRLIEVDRQRDALAHAYTALHEVHQACVPVTHERSGPPWAWKVFWRAVVETYHDAATRDHPDVATGDPKRMADLSAVYAELTQFIHAHLGRT